MAAVLKENYNDILEYVNNMKQSGVNEEMATYQAKYIDQSINKSVESKVDLAIARLNLERFATKEDIHQLENSIKQDIHRLENDIKDLRYDLEKQINAVKGSIQHLEYKIENKMFKHTALIIFIILLTNLPASMKDLLLHIVHLQ